MVRHINGRKKGGQAQFTEEVQEATKNQNNLNLMGPIQQNYGHVTGLDFLQRKLNFRTMFFIRNVGSEENELAVPKVYFNFNCELPHRYEDAYFSRLHQTQCNTNMILWSIENLGKPEFDVLFWYLHIFACDNWTISQLEPHGSDISHHWICGKVVHSVAWRGRNNGLGNTSLGGLVFEFFAQLATEFQNWGHQDAEFNTQTWRQEQNKRHHYVCGNWNFNQLGIFRGGLMFSADSNTAQVENWWGCYGKIPTHSLFSGFVWEDVAPVFFHSVCTTGVFYQLFFQQWDPGRIHFRSKGELHTGSFTAGLSCFMQWDPGGNCDGHFWLFEGSFHCCRVHFVPHLEDKVNFQGGSIDRIKGKPIVSHVYVRRQRNSK